MTSQSRNIPYRTPAIAQYFESHRKAWAEFYPSERWVLERLMTGGAIRTVLDVGCATGGLGLALEERFDLERYVGVEINPQAVDAARGHQAQYQCKTEFHLGDILELDNLGGQFDLVANLSCSDWNIEAGAITRASWKHVAPGGSLLISLRLTNRQSLNDFKQSYQFIRYDGDVSCTDEKANYVVFNVHDVVRTFLELTPRVSGVLGYGYWGTPSRTAVTPYDRLVFAVFAVTKADSTSDETRDVVSELHLPLSLWSDART